MRIILRKLVLTNFKGIRSLDIDFGHITNISGANATGKTTIFDAFLWLFFDKDSSNRKDFEIKTLDENNQPYHRLDHEVTAIVEVNGMEISIRKSMREKWTKPRGASSPVFDGHETSYFWNDVPLKKNEYQAKIGELINENTFRMLTNPLFFNVDMKWQERRAMLLQIAGDIDNVDILNQIEAGNDVAFKPLVAAMQGGKTIDEFKKELAVKKKKIKDELDLLPARIDEAKRSLPNEFDYDSLQSELATKSNELARIEDLLLNSSRAEKERQDRLGDLHARKQNLSRLLLDIEFNTKQQVKAKAQQRITAINDVQQKLNTITNQLTTAERTKANLLADKQRLQAEQQSLRNLWTKINAEQLDFNDNEFCCPTCKREFDATVVASKKEELIKNFNISKASRLETNVNRGKAVGNEILEVDAKLGKIEDEINDYKQQRETLLTKVETLENENALLSNNEEQEAQKAIENDAQYQRFKSERDRCEEMLNAPAQDTDKSELLTQKQELNIAIKDLEAKINTKSQKERTEARITELLKQEAQMAQELASLEGVEYSIEQFTKAKMDMLEQRVNGLFKSVRFKMFEEQINGGQAETCVALINGVPFSDANTASKINAGIDIINVLAGHFDVYAPIFIDNRESVVNVIDSPCQIINLIVSPNDKKLRVETTAEIIVASN